MDARTLTVRKGQSPFGKAIHCLSKQRRAAFEAVYLANFHRLTGYALRRASSPEDAADVVAETFLIAWRKFDDMPGNRETLLWLYGIARRVHSEYVGSGKEVLIGDVMRQDAVVRNLASPRGVNKAPLSRGQIESSAHRLGRDRGLQKRSRPRVLRRGHRRNLESRDQ